MRLLQAALIPVWAAAAEPELGKPLELKPGAPVIIAGLRIVFERVEADSRCPTGVQGIQAGDAASSAF